MLGLAPGAVALSDYHADWPYAFAEEASRILAVLPGLRIEHIGSTAVPGLAAKPVLDLMLGMDDIARYADCVIPLVALGYEHLGEHGIAGRHFFTRDAADGTRTHHLHLVARGSDLWARHLAFRDALRADATRRDAYAELKHRLAAVHAADRTAYTDAKSNFIAGTLAAIGC